MDICESKTVLCIEKEVARKAECSITVYGSAKVYETPNDYRIMFPVPYTVVELVCYDGFSYDKHYWVYYNGWKSRDWFIYLISKGNVELKKVVEKVMKLKNEMPRQEFTVNYP